MKHILGREHGELADFVLALAAFDRERQYLDLGYRSAWDFCRRELGLSEKQTWYRIAAAREVAKHPDLAGEIRAGRLCVTTLATLSKVMTEDNSDALVREATGKTARQVEQIVARLDPKPVPADVVRPVTAALPPREVRTEVLTETLLRKHLTVDAEYETLLAAARAALSHVTPGASELDILKQGLRRIVRDAEKRKGIVDQPRPDREAEDGDLPRSVQRAVWKRDGGQCQWRTADGGICGSTHQVQFHHRQDRSKGGLGSVDNVMLVCAVHYQHAADLTCGEAFMDTMRQRHRRAAERQEQLDLG